MKLKRYLRPAGDKILLEQGKLDQQQFTPYKLRFYQSGTAALAAAVIAARRFKPDVSSPEILIPAYGCPDLISAVVFAGAKPILVDLEPDLPWMSLSRAASLLSDRTVALIAVNFLGIRERGGKLREICEEKNVVLIEDSAQAFPIRHHDEFWQGDYNVISFGRGKPVNMLAGGAVLCKIPDFLDKLPLPPPLQAKTTDELRYILNAILYNSLIPPTRYSLIKKIPFTHIGETRFKTLSGIYPIPAPVLKRLDSNFNNYRTKTSIEDAYKRILNRLDEKKYQNLIQSTRYCNESPLLRLPLLIRDKSTRDQLLEDLKPYGASIMYKTPLPSIEGVNRFISNHAEDYPNATGFADKLLTLPLHEDVTQRDIEDIESVLNRYLA